MKLSIIIVSYNTRELLKKCLESVAECWRLGDSGRDIEIVIVDNGSTDGSVETVKEFIEKNSRQFESGTEKRSKKEELRVPLIRDNSCNLTIRLIENRSNMGFAKAVNQGIEQAQGEAILLLNSDTQVKPGALGELLQFEEKVRPAIIGARLLNPDGSVQSSVFKLPTTRRAILEYWFGKKGEFSKYAPLERGPVEVEAVVGGAMLISREIIEKVGLFDERYFMYFEDLDYCRRARKAGFRTWYLPTAEIIHEHGASGKDLTGTSDQWRRLIPSSKIYHGTLNHHFINFILWSGQKWQKLISCLSQKKSF